MSSNFCTSCGTEGVAGARFCRQCGQLLGDTPPPSVLEAETRTLGQQVPAAPVNRGAQTGYVASQSTGPAYFAPGEFSPLTAINQQPPASSGGFWKWAVLGLSAAVVVIVAMVIFGWSMHRHYTASAERRIVITPPIPPAPPAPPAIPGLPEGIGTGSGAVDSLQYPGSQVLMQIGDGDIIQMHSADPVDKVTDWYVAKLRPDKIVRNPHENAVLKADAAKVVINKDGDGTSILVKK